MPECSIKAGLMLAKDVENEASSSEHESLVESTGHYAKRTKVFAFGSLFAAAALMCAFATGSSTKRNMIFGPAGVQWSDVASKRIVTLAGSGNQVLPDGGDPRMNDVQQGQLGDCYLYAALAVIAHMQPSVIEAMFVDRHKWADGVFTTSWNFPPWSDVRVAVNDWVPGDAGAPYFGHPSAGIMWPLVLEKAFAKVYGNFKAIHSGNLATVLKAILQVPVLKYKKEMNDYDEEDVFKTLQEGTAKKFPMGFASKGGHGIAGDHAFGVLEVSEDYQGKGRCVRVYNPWNKNNYAGEIKDQARDTGDYWITWPEFLHVSEEISIARYIEGYVMSEYTVDLEGGEGQFAAEITTSDDKPFSVQLQYPDSRILPEGAGCTLESSYAHAQLLIWKKGDPHCTEEKSAYKTCFGSGGVQSTVVQLGPQAYRLDMPGGAGVYLVYVAASFPHFKWLPAAQVSVYGSDSLKSALSPDPEQTLFEMTGLCDEFTDDEHGHFTRIDNKRGFPIWKSDQNTLLEMQPVGWMFGRCDGGMDQDRFPPQDHLKCTKQARRLASEDCRAQLLSKKNQYCQGHRKDMKPGGGFSTLDSCMQAVEKDAECKSKRFDYNKNYMGQCKCAKGPCTGFNGAGGYSVYGNSCKEGSAPMPSPAPPPAPAPTQAPSVGLTAPPSPASTIPATCTKWNTTFKYCRGSKMEVLEICESPWNELWTWKQCASKCASTPDCDFWMLQFLSSKDDPDNVRGKKCQLKRNKGSCQATRQYAGGDSNKRCIQAATAEAAGTTTTTQAPANPTCAVNINRMKALDKGVTKDSDDAFPQVMASIGGAGRDEWEKFNHWIRFSDL